MSGGNIWLSVFGRSSYFALISKQRMEYWRFWFNNKNVEFYFFAKNLPALYIIFFLFFFSFEAENLPSISHRVKACLCGRKQLKWVWKNQNLPTEVMMDFCRILLLLSFETHFECKTQRYLHILQHSNIILYFIISAERSQKIKPLHWRAKLIHKQRDVKHDFQNFQKWERFVF